MSEANAFEGRGGYYGIGIAAAALGAGAALLFDPRSGKRRRALLRDQVSHAAHVSTEFAGKATRDARQRARGLYSEARALRNADADDRVVAERVRATLGRLTSHPGPIYVTCSDGVIRLRGDVLRSEVGAVLRGVERVRGVRGVVNELRVHDHPGRISSLQGAGAARSSPRFEFLQTNWSPAPRALAGATGVVLLASGLTKRTSLGYGLAAVGGALLARSVINRPLTHVLGVRTDESDGVHIQKTIEICAEPEEVYSYWRDLENFPRFMTHVRDVYQIDDTHYRWTVDGPAGMPVAFDAEITADAPGEFIAWRSINSRVVHNSGSVHFEPTNYGGARVHLKMTYRPLANLMGHSLAWLFGRDPKHQIDEDLLRFKSYVESGGPAMIAEARAQASSGGVEHEHEPIQH
jgi:uncharacterized membrane protein